MTTLTDDSLLGDVLAAASEDRELLNGSRSVDLLERIDKIARTHQCTALHGANPSGDRLVGAMLVRFVGDYRVWSPGDYERVLVMEGVAMSDVAVVGAMSFASTAGASDSVGVLVAPSWRPLAETDNDNIFQIRA